MSSPTDLPFDAPAYTAPVDVPRVIDLFTGPMGMTVEEKDGLVVGQWDGLVIAFSITNPSSPVLTARSTLNLELPDPAKTALAINDWHRSHFWPTLVQLNPEDEAERAIMAVINFDVSSGASDDQLSDLLRVSLATIVQSRDQLLVESEATA